MSNTEAGNNKCPMCDGNGYTVEPVDTYKCCMRPTENGSCCGNGVIDFEFEQVYCESCMGTGEAVATLNTQAK